MAEDPANVAVILRYVRETGPVSIQSADGLTPTRLLQSQLRDAGANVIDLTELSAQFQTLMFNSLACPVVDGETRACRDAVDYSQAAVRIVAGLKENAREAETYAPHLAPLRDCGGVLLIGEIASAPDPSRRDANRVEINWFAKDFAKLTDVDQGVDSRTASFSAAAGRPEILAEKVAVKALAADAARRVMQKIKQSDHYGNCGAG
ncbi:MAG: hypothetical protein ACFB00_10355 [Parvularculaceae bacterium]